jgi:hypothetical protein
LSYGFFQYICSKKGEKYGLSSVFISTDSQSVRTRYTGPE